MSWEQLEVGQVNDVPLALYRSGSDFMIRAGGLELMNSRWHHTESALALLAVRYFGRNHPKILIGGLGLGFTLDAVVREYGATADICVAEQSKDVIRWYENYFRAAFSFSSSPLRIFPLAVQAAIKANCYDIIILDVDNGPEPLSGEVNAQLYTVSGLKMTFDHLSARGVLLVWSAFQSKAFADNARLAGFQVAVESVKVGHKDHEHFIFVCRKCETTSPKTSPAR